MERNIMKELQRENPELFTNEVKNELTSIYQRISELEGSIVEKDLHAGDIVGSDTQIKRNIELISSAVYSGNISSVVQYKDDIIRVIRTNAPDGEQIRTTLEKLQQRRSELEGSIKGKSTYIYADMAGVMCSRIDGGMDSTSLTFAGWSFFSISQNRFTTPCFSTLARRKLVRSIIPPCFALHLFLISNSLA